MVKNDFTFLANHFRCLLTIAQESHNSTSVVLVCLTLHNILLTHYRADHQGMSNEENKYHIEIPGAWRPGHFLAHPGVLYRGQLC